MRWLVVSFVLSGCHKLFSLDEVSVEGTGDAYVDPEVPVNPMCPANGTGHPPFRMGVHEIASRKCHGYSVSVTAARASAVCTDSSPPVLEEGPIDGPLSPSKITIVPDNESVIDAWMSHNGDLLLAHQYDQMAPLVLQRIAAYDRVGDKWQYRNDVATFNGFFNVGVPSSEPRRRAFVSQGLGVYRELEEINRVWTEVATGSWSGLGAPSGAIAGHVNLSPDGLRVTFLSDDRFAYYTDRPSLDQPFRTAERIELLYDVRTPFLLPDCERIYFSLANSVLFRYLDQ